MAFPEDCKATMLTDNIGLILDNLTEKRGEAKGTDIYGIDTDAVVFEITSRIERLFRESRHFQRAERRFRQQGDLSKMEAEPSR